MSDRWPFPALWPDQDDTDMSIYLGEVDAGIVYDIYVDGAHVASARWGVGAVRECAGLTIDAARDGGEGRAVVFRDGQPYYAQGLPFPCVDGSIAPRSGTYLAGHSPIWDDGGYALREEGPLERLPVETRRAAVRWNGRRFERADHALVRG